MHYLKSGCVSSMAAITGSKRPSSNLFKNQKPAASKLKTSLFAAAAKYFDEKDKNSDAVMSCDGLNTQKTLKSQKSGASRQINHHHHHHHKRKNKTHFGQFYKQRASH